MKIFLAILNRFRLAFLRFFFFFKVFYQKIFYFFSPIPHYFLRSETYIFDYINLVNQLWWCYVQRVINSDQLGHNLIWYVCTSWRSKRLPADNNYIWIFVFFWGVKVKEILKNYIHIVILEIVQLSTDFYCIILSPTFF